MMSFSEEMEALVVKLQAFHLNEDSTQESVSTNQESTRLQRRKVRFGVSVERSGNRKPITLSTDDSAGTLRPPKAGSSAATRLEMWKNARRSKTSQRKEQKKPKQRVANVWIIGSSYIKRGERAAHQQFGQNFGLNAKVKWCGKGGMRWDGVLPRFYAELSSQRPPDVLVIHAGGNDLGLTSAQKLASVMTNQLRQLHADFPAMKIAFSSINERQAWRYGSPRWIDSNRKLVNSSVRKAVDSFGGVVIEHPQLKYYNNQIFQGDGVHFTQRGNELFLKSIHSATKKLLQDPLQRT